MSTEYVEQQDQGYWVTGTRVSLDSIVHAFRNGQTAESIVQSFPVLTLEQAYGAITFYLAHRVEVDESIERARGEFELRRANQDVDPGLRQKLTEARQPQP